MSSAGISIKARHHLNKTTAVYKTGKVYTMKKSKKKIIIVYPATAFEDWQIQRLPIMADYGTYTEGNDTFVEVYESNYKSIIKAVARRWGITPYCAMDRKGFLYPMPIGADGTIL